MNRLTEIGPFKILNSIGRGAFSTVKLVYHKDSNQLFACKVIPKKKICRDMLLHRFETEIRVNQQAHHPGLVEMFDLLKDTHNYYIILEFCGGGSLFDTIVGNGYLDEQDAKIYFKQIVEAIKYLHSIKISHRDIKPENILLDSKGKIKISDFGLARFVGDNNLVQTMCGSPCYTAPEILYQAPYDGLKSDMWSVGVLLYTMLTGTLPWKNGATSQIFQQIVEGKYIIPENISYSCRSLLEGLMTLDPRKRLSEQEVLDHPWLADVHEQYNLENTIYGPVSLRQIDKFFGKEISFGSIKKECVCKTFSTQKISFKATLRELIPNLYKRKKPVPYSTRSKKLDIPQKHDYSVYCEPSNLNDQNQNYSNNMNINIIKNSHPNKSRRRKNSIHSKTWVPIEKDE